MSWRDNLRPAKLGSAAFQVDQASAQLGRNVQLHEYPLRDTPYTEDMGRKARRLTLECYVLADAANNYNYMPERDALIAELEKPGSKTLVHPYLGELKVNVVECDGPRESTYEGGMARFSITVVESGEHVFPGGTTDTQAIVSKRVYASLQEVKVSFAQRFGVTGAADFVSDTAISQVQGFADTLRSVAARVTTLPEALSRFVVDLSDLSGAAAQLILAPATLSDRVIGLLQTVTVIVNRPADALHIVRDLFGYGDGLATAPESGASSRVLQQDNQNAWVQLIEQAALITAVQVAARLDFESADDALRLRDELLDVFDAQTEAVLDDTVYYALVDVRTAFVADMQQRAAQLNKLIKVTLPETTSTLALAYSLYGDAQRESEIVARNRLRDPLFMPAGTPLEVLSNG